MNQTPPLPQITSVDSLPPSSTSPIVVATTTDRLRITADSDDSSKKNLVSDIVFTRLPNTGCLTSYWDGHPAEEYTLSLRQWWEMVPDSYSKLGHGDTFTRSYSISTGYSATDTQTLSAELGVEAEGLSAKISAEFSNSVTLTTQETATETHEYTNDEPNTVKVIALYKLMSEIVALDNTGSVIPTNRGRKGNVEWFDDGGYQSGANLYYDVVQQTLPSIYTSLASASFPVTS
jgi:hypothetical protein